jgi:predicted negative regulator of RcsB-dependent stress response
VDGYVTDQEQVEALKRWWKANGKSIVAGVIIGLAIVSGGKWWFARQQNLAEQASQQYEQVLLAEQQGNKDVALQQGGILLEKYPNSNYAALTALVLAKLKVDQDDLDGARFYFQWVVDHAQGDQLKDVAHLRLARVLLAKGDQAGALQAVEAVDVKAFAAPAQELKGDILLAMGKRDQARVAYAAALAAAGSGIDQSRLQMKLAEVGGQGKS